MVIIVGAEENKGSALGGAEENNSSVLVRVTDRVTE